MRNIFAFVLIIFISGCGRNSVIQTNGNSIKVISLLSDSESEITNISDIASDIKYIPLQTTDNSLIRYIYDIRTTDDRLYISLLRQILCFDRMGNYLYKLDMQGRGPEEYTAIYDWDISLDNKLLIILASKKILFYNETPNGFVYLKALSFKSQPSKIRFSESQNSILLSYSVSGFEPFRNVLIDLDGDTIITRHNYYEYTKFGGNGFSAFTYDNINFRCNGKLSFKEMFSDTIFTLDASDKITPYLILDSEGKGITPQYMAEWENVFDNYDKYIHLTNIMEVSNYLIYRFSYEKTEHLVIYNKSVNRKFEINTKAFLKDDIIGGINFEPKFCNNGKFYSWIDVLSLKNYLSSTNYNKLEVKNPAMKKAMKDMVDSLDKTDNPVLIVVTLKN